MLQILIVSCAFFLLPVASLHAQAITGSPSLPQKTNETEKDSLREKSSFLQEKNIAVGFIVQPETYVSIRYNSYQLTVDISEPSEKFINHLIKRNVTSFNYRIGIAGRYNYILRRYKFVTPYFYGQSHLWKIIEKNPDPEKFMNVPASRNPSITFSIGAGGEFHFLKSRNGLALFANIELIDYTPYRPFFIDAPHYRAIQWGLHYFF